MTYGSRTTSHDAISRVAATGDAKQQQIQLPSTLVEQLLDRVSGLQVPHGWFLHFYVVSVAWSVFWAIQVILKTSIVQELCNYAGPGGAMSMNQVALTWFLMTAQGSRRLGESVTVGKATASKMWFVHWVLGIAFYTAMGISVWIEGAGRCCEANRAHHWLIGWFCLQIPFRGRLHHFKTSHLARRTWALY